MVAMRAHVHAQRSQQQQQQQQQQDGNDGEEEEEMVERTSVSVVPEVCGSSCCSYCESRGSLFGISLHAVLYFHLRGSRA